MPSTDIRVSKESPKQLSLLDGMAMIDGLANLATGMGGAKDKNSHNVWSHSGKNLDHVQLSARYREDWLSQKVCAILPQDMTREWRSFEDDTAKEADSYFEVSRQFREAYKWARLYGTSFIILDVADGRAIDKPINWNNLKPGCFRSMHVVDRTRIVATGDIDQAPLSPTYGMPTHYQFVNTNLPIHKDRIIRFEGTELPIYERQRNLWYSDSVLIPLMQQIDNFHIASTSAANLVQEANVDVISIPGLQQMLMDDLGTTTMLKRFSDWKQIKSLFGVSILDSQEIYEKKSVQLSGVKDLIWEYLKVVAAAVGIPATRFLSASPDGMNATGESDLVNYVEFLMGLQRGTFDPRLAPIDTLMSAHFGLDRDAFKYEWKCIFPESKMQKAEREKIEAEKLKTYTDAGILSRESALQEAKDAGAVSKSATIGENPNPPKPTGVSTSATK